VALDPNAVGRTIAHGATDANAQAQAAGEHKATDIWKHTASGMGHQGTTDILHLPPSDFSSTPLSDVPGALKMQAGDLGGAVAEIGKAQGALATTGAVFGALTAAEQLVSIAVSAIPFPAFPAVRIMDTDIGLPHAHSHPPNLIPPAPPVPLPSAGPVIPIPYVSGAGTVLINGMPAGRCGDMGMGIWCGGYFPMFEIFLGSSSVWIEGARAARIGVDITKHCMFSTPKPNDPPLGPMIGTTVSASPNVIIGGVPMPSLSAMAIGAAMKLAFKGVIKLVGKVRAFSRAARKAAEEEAAAAAARAAKRNELIARTGEPSGVHWTSNRAREVPYKTPPDMCVLPRDAPPVLDPKRKYLWVVDPDGNVRIAPEDQAGLNRPLKHGDLTPSPDAQTRGPARNGGELNYNEATGKWEMDNNSSYAFNRADGALTSSDNLNAAHELMEHNGMNMDDVDTKFTDYRR